MGYFIERKKVKQLPNHCKKSKLKSNSKLNKTWVYESCEFYNRSMKSWSQNNNTKIYLTIHLNINKIYK